MKYQSKFNKLVYCRYRHKHKIAYTNADLQRENRGSLRGVTQTECKHKENHIVFSLTKDLTIETLDLGFYISSTQTFYTSICNYIVAIVSTY